MAKERYDFASTLSELENLKIPRFLFCTDYTNIRGFSDSSSLAYLAAIYIKSIPLAGYSAAKLLGSHH